MRFILSSIHSKNTVKKKLSKGPAISVSDSLEMTVSQNGVPLAASSLVGAVAMPGKECFHGECLSLRIPKHLSLSEKGI